MWGEGGSYWTQNVSHTFLILRRTERDMIKNVKYPLLLSDFNETWIFSTVFSKNTQMLNLVKIRPVGAELFHADGRTDRTMLIIVAVRNCANAPKENPILIQLILQLLSPVILVHYSIQNVHNTSCPIKPVFTYLTTNHGKCIACLLCKL